MSVSPSGSARRTPQADSEGRPIPIYGEDAFEGMRLAGRLASSVLDRIAPHVKPGVSTGELDRLCEGFMREAGAVPATLGYRGFPKASCISVNHVVTHGIPSDTKLLGDGDILNIDVTPILGGWHGDASRMFTAGRPSILARRLMAATEKALNDAVSAVRPGASLADIARAVEAVAAAERFSIVREFCGHGVGREFHDAPLVMHHGTGGAGVILEPGMIFTIEPMLNAGRADVKILADTWTTVTSDRSLSAQYEHSVGVTETGVEVFTVSR